MISFTSFLSNHAVVQTLQRAASPAGRLSHAYLLHGTKGLGKRTLARIFAAGLLCGADERPCGQCNSCHKVEKESHPDLMVLRRQADKSVITVEQIRTMREQAWLRPNESERRVILLEGADQMNPVAVGALLKILEEPPSYLVFILTADNMDAMPDTIASRCVCLELSEVPRLQAEKWLVRQFPDEDAILIDRALLCGGGNLGRCIAFLKGEREAASFELALTVMKSLTTGREFDIMTALSPLEGDREGFLQLLTDLDQLAGQIARAGFILPESSEIAHLAAGISPARAIRIHQLGDGLRRRLILNGNLSLLLGTCCAGLRQIMEQPV